MTVDYLPFDPSMVPSLDTLFHTNRSAGSCWCMWFLMPVKQFHANGGELNRAAFTEMAAAAEDAGEPAGVLAVDGGEVVGWCAVGPRSRFTRGIRTPTYQGRDAAEDDTVWLVPCFFVRPDRRRTGITAGLLEAAVGVAAKAGAVAVEGFPMAADGPHTGSDKQVGEERVFTEQGFRVVRAPSRNRVVVRREL